MGTVIHRLSAKDLDVDSIEALNFAATDPIKATDKNGKEVKSDQTFKVKNYLYYVIMHTTKNALSVKTKESCNMLRPISAIQILML